MNTRRVVITGIGAVTAVGQGREGLWQGVLQGQSPIRPMQHFDPSPYRAHLAAEIDLDVQDYLERKQIKRLDRFAQFALIAARMAVADAGLSLSQEVAERVGVSIGSALGGITMAETQHQAFLQHGLKAVQSRPGAGSLWRLQCL